MEERLPTFILRKRRWIEQYKVQEEVVKKVKNYMDDIDNKILTIAQNSNEITEKKNTLYSKYKGKRKQKIIDEYLKLNDKLMKCNDHIKVNYLIEKKEGNILAESNKDMYETIRGQVGDKIKELAKKNKVVRLFSKYDEVLEQNNDRISSLQKSLDNLRERYKTEKKTLRTKYNALKREYGVDMLEHKEEMTF